MKTEIAQEPYYIKKSVGRSKGLYIRQGRSRNDISEQNINGYETADDAQDEIERNNWTWRNTTLRNAGPINNQHSL